MVWRIQRSQIQCLKKNRRHKYLNTDFNPKLLRMRIEETDRFYFFFFTPLCLVLRMPFFTFQFLPFCKQAIYCTVLYVWRKKGKWHFALCTAEGATHQLKALTFTHCLASCNPTKTNASAQSKLQIFLDIVG